MRRSMIWLGCPAAASTTSIVVSSQSRVVANTAIYEGARLIIGDGVTTIENGAFVVQNGRIMAVGRRGSVAAPAGATHVDLTGKTVMPTMVISHAHPG